MAKHLYALFNDPTNPGWKRPAGYTPSIDSFVTFVTESPFTGTPKLKEFKDADGNPIAYNLVMDWHELELTSWAYVETLAAKATEQFGTRHIPTQSGNRFGIGTVPSIGDKVSYTINADYTPCGEVERITPSLTVITTSGMRFRRLKKTGGWVREGTTYCYLAAGHIDERNPEV